ncbi:MAG: peptide deformylase [Fidelibacterota bacterium]|nr:MAG: peptide deformylase [Candidatus Neomarinimicrobiota bacterium]
MAVFPIVKYGDPLLRKHLKEITDIPEILKLVDDMFETMYEEAGMGLAANQVGIDMNFAVIDISHAEEDEYPRIFINPEILDSTGRDDMEEGCLSIPEIRATIPRPERVLVSYLDEKGDYHEEWFDGLLGRVIQHEVDHLNGVFYIDHLTPAKHAIIDKRLAEIAETGAPSTGIVL